MNWRLAEPLAVAPSSRGFRVGLVAAAVALFALYYYMSWTQYLAGRVLGDPVIYFNAMLSSNAAGRWLVNPYTQNFYFCTHLELWFFPATLLYIIHDGLPTYIALVDLALAAVVVPLGLFARRATGSVWVAAALCVLWAFNTLTVSLLFALHCENLVLVPWFVLFWAVESNRKRWMWIAVAVLLCVKEDSPVWLTVFALWLGVFGRLKWRDAGKLAGVAVAAYIVFRITISSIPVSNPGERGEFWVAERFGENAHSLPGLLIHFVSHPIELARDLASPVWRALILAGGFVCVLGWRALLLLLPPAIFFLSSDWDEFNQLLYYYSYPFLPPLFLAAAQGSRWILERAGRRRAAEFLLAAAIALIGLGQLVLGRSRTDHYIFRPFEERPHEIVARRFVQEAVPREERGARAMAQLDLAAYVPRGSQLVPMKAEFLDRADRVLLDRQGEAYDITAEELKALRAKLDDPQGPWRLAKRQEGLELYMRQH